MDAAMAVLSAHAERLIRLDVVSVDYVLSGARYECIWSVSECQMSSSILPKFLAYFSKRSFLVDLRQASLQLAANSCGPCT